MLSILSFCGVIFFFSLGKGQCVKAASEALRVIKIMIDSTEDALNIVRGGPPHVWPPCHVCEGCSGCTVFRKDARF